MANVSIVQGRRGEESRDNGCVKCVISALNMPFDVINTLPSITVISYTTSTPIYHSLSPSVEIPTQNHNSHALDSKLSTKAVRW